MLVSGSVFSIQDGEKNQVIFFKGLPYFPDQGGWVMSWVAMLVDYGPWLFEAGATDLDLRRPPKW